MGLMMSEHALATLATSAALGTATATTALLPGIDGNALVGAVAGAALFVTSSHDLPLIRRVIYLVISTVVGYLAAPEVLAHLPLQSTALAAFLAGALVVTLTMPLIERAKTFDLSTLFRKGD
jgi:putative holin